MKELERIDAVLDEVNAPPSPSRVERIKLLFEEQDPLGNLQLNPQGVAEHVTVVPNDGLTNRGEGGSDAGTL